MKTKEEIEDAYGEASERIWYYESNQSKAFVEGKDKKLVEEVKEMRKKIERDYDNLLDGNKGRNYDAGDLYGRFELLKWIFSDED